MNNIESSNALLRALKGRGHDMAERTIGILDLWERGYDTLDIAAYFQVHESEIANRLIHLRNRKASGAIQDNGVAQ